MATTTQLPAAVVEQRKRLAETTRFLQERVSKQPRIALILGSGLGELAHDVEDAVVIPYAEIPHFPVSTAPGHAGNLVFGRLGGQDVVLMQGRFHSYEGYTPQETTYPVRVFRALGVETLIVTCATGGLNPAFKAGDIMLLSDHLNLTGNNPLIGINDPDWGPRFPVMFDAYKAELRAIAHAAAKGLGQKLHEGVYAGIAGPAFFTEAEVRHLMTIGADAIGMSTVHETIAAVHGGMKVLGIGMISDMANPDLGGHATETEILETVRQTAGRFRDLVQALLVAL